MIDPRLPVYAVPPRDFQPKTTGPDPDYPGWSIGGGVGVWGISVLFIFITSLLVQSVWVIRFHQRTGKMPTEKDLDATLTFWTIISTFVAHILTLIVCVVFVRRSSKYGFLESLGLDWLRNLTPQRITTLILCVFCTPLFLVLGGILSRYIPNAKTQLDQILAAGLHIRIAVAMIAAFSAPLVEEIVYRGILFGALRKRFDEIASVTIVSLMFLAVHIPQYWGGWAGLTLLAILSLALTIIRARTKSVLPGIVIHFVFNGIQAIGIIFFFDKIK